MGLCGVLLLSIASRKRSCIAQHVFDQSLACRGGNSPCRRRCQLKSERMQMQALRSHPAMRQVMHCPAIVISHYCGAFVPTQLHLWFRQAGVRSLRCPVPPAVHARPGGGGDRSLGLTASYHATNFSNS